MIYFYVVFIAWFVIVLLNAVFIFDFSYGLKIVWSDDITLMSMDRVTEEKHGNNIGYTNRYEDFTYRIKPFIKISIKSRLK